MFGTRTSAAWATQPGKFDVLNLRNTYPGDNPNHIPDLKPTNYIPTSLAAWNMPRHLQHAAKTGGAIHFFLDDYRFETAWSAPERLLPRVQQVGAALTPDFSLWLDMPRAAQIWNTYRSRWCGAYWQNEGIEVIPTACWGAADTYDFCFDGIPSDSTVAITSLGIRSNVQDRTFFRAGLLELIRRKQPKLLLAYGRLRFCDDIDLPEVREYPTFWDRRRKQIKTWEEEDLEGAEGQEQLPLLAGTVQPGAVSQLASSQPVLLPLTAAAGEAAVVVAAAAAVAVQPGPALVASREAEVLVPVVGAAEAALPLL